jgi:hypothetical protein
MSTLVKTPSNNSGGSALVQTAQLSSPQKQQPGSRSIELTTTAHSSTKNINTTNPSSDLPSNGSLQHGKCSTERQGDGVAAAPSQSFPTTTTVGAETKPKQAATTLQEESRSEIINASKQSMYPEDIRRILVEVAQTGGSSVLRWTEKESRPSTAAASTASVQSSYNEGLPPRKRLKNGICSSHSSLSPSSHHRSSGGLKRPLATATTTTARNSNFLSGNSERDDNMSLSPYDSEDTSTSEISIDRAQRLLNGVVNGLVQHNSKQNGKSVAAATAATTSDNTAVHMSTNCESTELSTTQGPPPTNYRSLRQVFYLATASVLDYFFQHKRGYKLSPAERRRNSMLLSSVGKTCGDDTEKKNTAETATDNVGDESLIGEEVFKQRKQRLLKVLSDADEISGKDKTSSSISLYRTNPPFTIQRIAEVLLTPERYYTQTHKLCNCLEKLLLVTSSIEAFGGTTGGHSSQTCREEQEMAALADERGRLMSEYRRKEIKRRMSASSEGEPHMEDNDRNHAAPSREEGSSSLIVGHHRPEEMVGVEVTSKGDIEKEELLEAARASLRSKFDHVGIDPHSAVANANREQQTGNRSPPPPNFPGSAGGMALAGHAHGALLRAHHDQEPPGAGGHALAVRTPSPPIMFQSTDGGSSPKSNSPAAIRPTHQSLQLLQMHHAAVLGGVSPFDLIGLNGGSSTGAPVAHASSIGSLSAGIMSHMREMDVECRSSASSDIASSDLDSESDDVSFDDSASDRSDGSDSGALPSSNPAVARALALNRAQQQQQPQRRMLGSATSSAFSSQRGVAQQHPIDHGMANSEYQSGDSVDDSLRADDSDSSSDMAD